MITPKDAQNFGDMIKKIVEMINLEEWYIFNPQEVIFLKY